MDSTVKIENEPFIRVRFVRFSDGTQIQSLKDIRLKVETFDFQQMSSNRPKFPRYDEKIDGFLFETRTKQRRAVTISVYINIKETNYLYKTTIEELIRNADGIIREYRFTNKSRGWMSIELIAPPDVREAQRTVHDTIRKHYGHEFLIKYFTTLPAFCGECKKILWGFNTPGYRCQLCDLVVHEQCINQVPACKQLARSNSLSIPTTEHTFFRDANFWPVFCDHDGKIIRPLQAWKCSECRMVVHTKCKSKVAHFCGTRQIAVKMYEEWKEQNKVPSIETYTSPEDCTTKEMEEKNRDLLMNIYQRLQSEDERKDAAEDLDRLTKVYEPSSVLNDNVSSYYNRSVVLLHSLTFCASVGHGMAGSVYWVKHSGRDFALKALRKHRILEGNEYESVKHERNILILCRDNPFINQLYAVFHDFQRVYFLLEYAPCGAFYNFLMRYGSQFDNDCIKWFSGQIICGISYLHSKLIVHRDLKPENVLLMRDGRLKLADFGFCKNLSLSSGTTRTFCGTAEYIAPEIYQRLNYSFPVDYWAIGVMIYEMIALKTPFYHSTEIEIRNHVINKDFQYPDKISSELRMLLAGLLAKNPKERFGINEIKSTNYYSSPYLLEDIEQGLLKSPWKKTIPFDPSPDTLSSSQPIHLSHMDQQSICTTLTVDKTKFRDFSYMGF